MYIPLGIKTDYSLLESLIKIKDLPPFFNAHNITSAGILDNNLSSVMEFYNMCNNNGIKPIIGLKVKITDKTLYLYAQNYKGYQNLLKINTAISLHNLELTDIIKYQENLKIVIPFPQTNLFEELQDKITNLYLSYKNISEKRNSLIITNHIVMINEITIFTKEDEKYLKVLDLIRETPSNYENNYYLDETDIDETDIEIIQDFINDIDLKIPKNQRYIPKYDSTKDSYLYLKTLAYKGLTKRLETPIPNNYQERLDYELKVINDLGFTDYFLIVYDYVKYAKTHDILVGPGRGSAAGSLVSYSIGITNINPMAYNLLFERFLNPERVTMPDIDIDFEDTKREEMIAYVRTKYGEHNVAPIMTYGTLTSKQVLKDVSKALKGNTNLIETLTKNIDSKLNLENNLKLPTVKSMVNSSKELTNIYKIALKLEGLKRHTSTHAAGVVISSLPIDEVIPIIYNGDVINTGITSEYLEELGFLKMDFLAIANLTVIHNVTKLIGPNFDINKINFQDKTVFDIFSQAQTDGIFQFESSGMKAFLKKLKPTNFNDLIAAIALFRPGPMDNIDTFIARKEGKEKVTYPALSLKPILQETYGIIVYQEQIMQILVTMANYTFAQADNIRRAMSKKKYEIIKKEEENFINQSLQNGYNRQTASEVFQLILKFANYGFNKSHSVSYAIVGYQMAYLKAHYPTIFLGNLLNMCIGSEIKTKQYLQETKLKNIMILKPNINLSLKTYKIGEKKIRLPLSIIKNVGVSATNDILLERQKNGLFKDFYDFVVRCYGTSVTKKTIEALIDADALSNFNVNHHTLKSNIDNAISYQELIKDLDESLVEKPLLELKEEYSDEKLMKDELASYGFYITNHPASKYQENIVKINKIKQFFNKHIKMVVLIQHIKKIKTKKNDDMAFINANDETGTIDFTVFPNTISKINNIDRNDLVLIDGIVERRLDKYQINVLDIKKVK